MDTMVKNELPQLMNMRNDGPFIAIYLNTTAVLNDLNQRRLELKQLVSDARADLAQRFPGTSFTPFQQQFDRLINDNDFWLQHTGPQTGLIANQHQLLVFDLQYPAANQAIVNRMPAIRPILADRQHEFDFDLLALNEDTISMYAQRQGNFTTVELPADAPTTLRGTLGTEKRGGDLNFNSSPVHGANFHGHNAKGEEKELDQKNYYQRVAQYLTGYSQETQRPLILMGLPHNQALFRRINKNNYLSADLFIEKSPKNLSLGAMQTATEAVQTTWHTQLADLLLKRYDRARSQKLALSDPFDMIKPALSGRIEMLIVTDNANVPGTLPTADVVLVDANAAPDNLIDDLVDVTMAKNGQVRIVPENRLPAGTTALAILRY